MVEIDSEGTYAYRALAPEGVVVGIRVVDSHRGDLEFWTRATELRMRQLNGYALLGTADVRSRDGTPGRELRFGHDEKGKPYLYAIRVYVTQPRLIVVETGGPKEVVVRYQTSLDWMQSSIAVR
ncbi:MAG: hypothetical protein ABTD50_23670 [Polyangiaceae bacterium]|jgi:hypothetical protein